MAARDPIPGRPRGILGDLRLRHDAGRRNLMPGGVRYREPIPGRRLHDLRTAGRHRQVERPLQGRGPAQRHLPRHLRRRLHLCEPVGDRQHRPADRSGPGASGPVERLHRHPLRGDAVHRASDPLQPATRQRQPHAGQRPAAAGGGQRQHRRQPEQQSPAL